MALVVPEGIWEVVLDGPGPGGGAPVTEGEDPSSSSSGRLAKGSFVRQLSEPSGHRSQRGRRLQFEKLCGAGPQTGWLTTSLKEKDYLARNYDVQAKNLRPKANEAPPPSVGQDGRRPYDIVIYGATGFTGTLAVEHLDAVLAARGGGAGGCRWAVAGRSAARLRPLADRCKTRPGIVQASEPEELAGLAACCRVLLAAAGPYQRCGEAVVKACIDHGTHYVDVTGEVPWVHEMVSKYHAAARQKGVMIVHAAGQICTIDEMNLYLLVQKLGPLVQFREYFCQFGDMTGGTLDTNIATMKDMTAERLEVMRDPFSLGGVRRGGVRPEDADCTAAVQDVVFPTLWLQPAYSTPTGSRICRRSCQLFDESPADGLRYGDALSVTIREGSLSQQGAKQQIARSSTPASVDTAQVFASTMMSGVSQGQAPKPGQGPPPETRRMYYSEVYAVAEGENGQWAHVHYSGPEAYEATAVSCVTAALTMAEETERLRPESRGGVLSPAFALHGSGFAERLQATAFGGGGGRRMSFDIRDGKPPEEEVKEVIKAKMKNAATTQADIMGGKLKAFA